MFERLKTIIEACYPRDDSLENAVKGQLIEAYKLGFHATRMQQDELVQICAGYIFDLMDWGRRHLEHFSDDEALFQAGFDHQDRVNPATLRDFESMVEGELVQASQDIESSLPVYQHSTL